MNLWTETLTWLPRLPHLLQLPQLATGALRALDTLGTLTGLLPPRDDASAAPEKREFGAREFGERPPGAGTTGAGTTGAGAAGTAGSTGAGAAGDRTAALGAGAGASTAGELAWASRLFFGGQPWERWNGDDLLARHGAGIYRRMLHDDQLRALVTLKQAVITSRRWRFETLGEHPLQQRCAAFFRHVLNHQLRGTFSQSLRGVLSSQVQGFSVTEVVFAQVHWAGRGYWGVAALKLRPAETFSFEGDAHGNLTAILQEQSGRPVRLPPERFIIQVNKPEVDPFYGESDLRECYRHWWAKDNILKFWNIYLERLAAGFVHGRISGPLTTAERDDLKQVLHNLSAQTSIITPANVELKMLTAPSTDAFERAVAARDKAMAKALLVPNLLGFSEQGQVGSYSQSQTQLETFLLAMNGQAENLADLLNEQLFRPLGRWNFGLSDVPRFVFEPLTDDQRRQLAASWQQAVAAGVVTSSPQDEVRTRELLDYPVPAASSALSGASVPAGVSGAVGAAGSDNGAGAQGASHSTGSAWATP